MLVAYFSPSPPSLSLVMVSTVYGVVSISTDSVAVTEPGGCLSQGCMDTCMLCLRLLLYLGSTIPKAPLPSSSIGNAFKQNYHWLTDWTLIIFDSDRKMTTWSLTLMMTKTALWMMMIWMKGLSTDTNRQSEMEGKNPGHLI